MQFKQKIKNNTFRIFILQVLAFLPILAFAEVDFDTLPDKSLFDILLMVYRTLARLIPIVFGLAVVFFFWTIARFIFGAGDPKTVQSGKKFLIWGTLALVVISSIWGITLLFQDALGGSTPSELETPKMRWYGTPPT